MRNPTTRFLVTLPQSVAEKYQIQSGDELEGLDGGSDIRIIPPKTLPLMLSTQDRLRLLDEATSRQRARETQTPEGTIVDRAERGWTREEVYDRGCAR